MTLKSLMIDQLGLPTKTIRMKTIRPVFETLTIHEVPETYFSGRTKVTTSAEIFRLFGFLANESKEVFLCLHLDSKNRIVCIDQVSTGSLNASIVHPREVFKSVMLSSAAAVLFLHNHPSGDPTPSREDLELTTRLKQAGDLLGVRVLDHIIIGNGCYQSLADQGML